MSTLDKSALDQLFFQARTHNAWLDKPVSDELLHELYDTFRMGPTSANSSPLRVVFVKTPEAKARLKPGVNEQNVEKTMTAPVTAIVAYDAAFYEQMGKLFPARDFRGLFASMPAEAQTRVALMNASLQCAYLVTAARALGLDCGPMAGFDSAKVDAAFLEGTTWKSFLLVNLGYGDASKVFPRNPRLSFEDAARIV